MSQSPVLTASLLEAIRKQYRLRWEGIHGVSHWTRVRTIGLCLAEHTGADPIVVELFAVFHDGDSTVQTCWDADRLDLGRVGIPPDPARLCTAAAKDPRLFAWATRRYLLGAALDNPDRDEYFRAGCMMTRRHIDLPILWSGRLCTVRPAHVE